MSIDGQNSCAVAAVIACMGNVQKTRGCIRSLLAEGAGVIKIIVVENGTRENTENLSPEFPQVEFLPLPKNEGFAGGANHGALYAKTRFDPRFYFFLQRW